uniref:Uncharacterized protein n=1 Tax=Solanum lycopersicum TaxID=4081 RepID=A0A3Q7GPF5_SOLLC
MFYAEGYCLHGTQLDSLSCCNTFYWTIEAASSNFFQARSRCSTRPLAPAAFSLYSFSHSSKSSESISKNILLTLEVNPWTA